MLYQIESVQMKKSKKRIIVYVFILLFVLFISIVLGIWAAKNIKQSKEDGAKQEEQVEIKNGEKTEQTKEYEAKRTGNTSKFVKNVNNIYNGDEKRAFLTFDDGPSKAVTPHILDTLKAHNIKATFFVLGNRVKLNPDLVKRAYDEGHYIANHGYSHKYSKIYVSSKTVIEEYNKTEEQIRIALGNPNYSSNLFRFPGGSVGGTYHEIKKEAKVELAKQNIAYLDWDALTNDAAGANTKEKIMKNLKKTVGNKKNLVILMHDAPDKILTYETLEDVIKYLQDRGYAFKNMYDLMEKGE